MALLFFAVIAAAALRPDAAAAADPPVAAYSFDAGGGEVAEDLIGENDGTLEGAEWFDKGKYGSALLFDGEETCVTVPHHADLQLSEELTLEAWVKPSNLSDQPVIYKSAWGNLGYAMGIDFYTPERLEGLIGEGVGKYEDVVSSQVVEKNVWSHLAFTYDGATMRIYINGNLVGSQAQSTPPPTGEGPLAIGCNPLYPEDFDGLIDEVRIYDYARDAGEIAADKGAPLQTPPRDPIAAYSFDEGEGEVAEDLFGENDGALEHTEWVKGKYGSALYFDGDGDDMVRIANNSELQLAEEFTLEAWVRPDSARVEAPVFEKRTPGFYSYKLSAGGETAGLPEGFVADKEFSWEEVTGKETLANKAWSHLAMTYDGAAIRLYVNGELVDTNNAPGPQASTGALLIGADDAEDAFKGRIDEVRVYDRALDAGEIAADEGTPVKTPPSAPVAAYSFDEGEGEVAVDLTGGNDGTLEGVEWSDKGKYGSALLFEGSETCVTVPHAAELELGEEMTLEAWVKPSNLSDQPVLYKSAWGNLGYAMGISFFEYAKFEGLIGEGEGKFENAVSPNPIEKNVWSHLAFTYDGAKMRLYVNGELVATELQSTPPPGGEGPLAIGCNPLYPEDFDGLIDEVRIYDRALGAGEIAADKGAALQTPSRAPVAAYSFDEGEGEVAEDLFGENDGTIEGAEWFGSGRYGSALLFEGSETCVTVPHAAELELGEEMTLEAWVKPSNLSDQPVLYKSAWGNLGYAMGIDFYTPERPEGLIGEGVGKYEDVVSSKAVEKNVWNHLAFTYDGATMRLYINGELVATQAQSTPPPGGEGPLAIGCNPLYPEDFDGLIDEVRIYDRALGVDEVVADARTWLESPARGPVAAYSLDTGEGAVAEDLVGENNGTIEGASWFANGKYGKALSFDGVDDCVSVEDAPGLQLPEDFTLQSWVKPKGTGIDEPILSKETEGYFSYALYLGLQASGRVEGLLGGEEEEIGPDVESDGALPINVWSHVAVTYDGARMRLYVNGELQDTAFAELGAFASSGPLKLGCSEAFEDNFKGLIDEPRLYDRALGPEEIALAMRVPLAATATTEAYGVDATEAVLVGKIGSHNEETEYQFEYGTTSAYGNTVPEMNEDIVVSDEDREVEEAIFDLEPETTYHYRLVATSASGTVVGKDKTFTTGTASKSNLLLAEERTTLLNNTNWRGKEFVNVQWSGNTGETTHEAASMDNIQASGARILRIMIDNTDSDTDKLFERAANRGITILPGLGGGLIPRNDKGDNIRDAWRKKVRNLVKEYGRGGTFWQDYWKTHSPKQTRLEPLWWEVWNEQNYGKTASVGEKVLPREYADLLDETHEVVKSVEEEKETAQEAKLLFGGLLSVSKPSKKNRFDKMPVGQYIKAVDKYLESFGTPDTYEALSLHPYAFRGCTPKPTPKQLKACKKNPLPDTAGDVEGIREKVRRNIKAARSALDLGPGGKGKKIWITELGWPVDTKVPPNADSHDGSHLPVGEEIQRELLNSTFNMVKSRSEAGEQSYNIKNVFYYNIEDWIEQGDWAYRAGLREDNDYQGNNSGKEYGKPGNQAGLCRKAWFAFQNQAEHEAPCP